MEMQEIAAEGEKTEAEDVEASEPMLEAKTEAVEEEEEDDAYSKLQNLPEDIYSEAFYGDPPVKPKAGKQTEGNAWLYLAVCIVLAMICLVLLLVIIFLSVKLQTGSTVCPEREEGDTQVLTPSCSLEECQTYMSIAQPERRDCQQCAKGWLTFGRSCFFLSTFRLSWDLSQRNCSARGGSLAVINSQRVQRYLTKEGKMSYWIGLRQRRDKWTWVNNTVLGQSYWADVAPEGDCGILSTESPPEKNWVTASCHAYTYFICQLQM